MGELYEKTVDQLRGSLGVLSIADLRVLLDRYADKRFSSEPPTFDDQTNKLMLYEVKQEIEIRISSLEGKARDAIIYANKE